MAGFALQGLKLGAEHLPDSAFEKIPYAGPRYFKEGDDNQNQQNQQKQQKQQGRQGRQSARNMQRAAPLSDSDPYDSDPESEYERQRRARRSHRRSVRDDHRKQDRGYDSNPESPSAFRGYNGRSRGGQDERSSRQDPNSQSYGNNPYFPPPPTRALDDAEMGVRHDSSQRNAQPAYGPIDDSTTDGRRGEYYEDSQSTNTGYMPPNGPPPSQRSRARFENGQSRNGPAGTRSSIADRYRPHDDQPYSPPPPSDRYDRGKSPSVRSGRASPNPNYPSAVAIRPHSDYYASEDSLNQGYDNRYDDDEDEEEDDRRHRQQRRSSKSNRQRSGSRFSEARDKARDGFEQHKGEIGAGALGALAGGLLGREFGGSGKRANLGMVIGAALGGVGAGLYGKRQEKHDGSRDRSVERSRGRRQYAGYESH